jgi:hypothetical protein
LSRFAVLLRWRLPGRRLYLIPEMNFRNWVKGPAEQSGQAEPTLDDSHIERLITRDPSARAPLLKLPDECDSRAPNSR